MVSLYTLTEVWNRACIDNGGPQPELGDRALVHLLMAHNLICNGGVHHALKVLSKEEWSSAVSGYRYFGLNALAGFLESLPGDPELGEWTGKTEAIVDPVSYTHLTLPTNREV